MGKSSFDPAKSRHHIALLQPNRTEREFNPVTVNQSLSDGRSGAAYGVRVMTVSFTGMERVNDQFPTCCVGCPPASFLSLQSNNKGPQAQALSVSWRLADGMVVRLLY
ncbi:hypothetical protein AM571_PA00114 (plasmid) [Rhizobium etli 8C-3]|uniref:Uncharacterized protein n=1 Tax=Rhizobium etli 8C-3 TaxID=538025 RepID=A0A1L5PA05_RHIET|nr:hypothetical protein AM571_PA00114 [Rhizobium etli 8C-3]